MKTDWANVGVMLILLLMGVAVGYYAGVEDAAMPEPPDELTVGEDLLATRSSFVVPRFQSGDRADFYPNLVRFGHPPTWGDRLYGAVVKTVAGDQGFYACHLFAADGWLRCRNAGGQTYFPPGKFLSVSVVPVVEDGER